jgi:hypothetical protein
MGKHLKLDELTVHSFVTELNDDAANKIRGGWTEGTSQITAGETTCHWICLTRGICTFPGQCCNPGPLGANENG